MSWIKRLALPRLHKKKRLKRLRYRSFNVAARVIHHGRCRILKFARGLHRLVEIREAYKRIGCLQFG